MCNGGGCMREIMHGGKVAGVAVTRSWQATQVCHGGGCMHGAVHGLAGVALTRAAPGGLRRCAMMEGACVRLCRRSSDGA